MKDKIQITVEQAREMWNKASQDLEDTLINWKEKGYIKMTKLDEAREYLPITSKKTDKYDNTEWILLEDFNNVSKLYEQAIEEIRNE